jgi:hypothetical protein
MMKLELEVKTKEEAEKLIEQLQGFIEENNENLYPNISGFDNYYHIDNWGIVKKTSGKTGSTEYLANIYKTEKIAKKALEFKKNRKVWNFIENWAMHNSTFEPDWEDGEQVKYYVWYDSETFIWDMYYTYTTNVGIVYMSKEECEKLEEILNSSDKYKL